MHYFPEFVEHLFDSYFEIFIRQFVTAVSLGSFSGD